MYTKGQCCLESYEELRIWGLTSTPNPSEIAAALNRLESMMSRLQNQYNFTINYNFEETPNINSPTGTEEQFRQMIRQNLAVTLIPPFGKDVPQALLGQASSSFSSALGLVQMNKLQQIQPSRRMPIGNGNTYRGFWWNRFAVPTVWAPNEAPTKYIIQGEQFNYFEDFSWFLEGQSIASYTIAADPLLEIVTSANNSPLINYTIQAPSQITGNGPLQQVMITITDTSTPPRTFIQLINFNVYQAPTVGPNN